VEFGGDVRTCVVRCARDLVDDLRAAIDDRDDVAEIAAAEEIAVPTALEGFKLGGEEVGRGDGADACARWQFVG
jgi:hypothetical protein